MVFTLRLHYEYLTFEGSDLQGFTLAHAHQLPVEVITSTTTMGCTCMGKWRMMPFGNDAGRVCLLSRPASIPRRRGLFAGSSPCVWRRNDEGFATGDGNPRKP